MSEIKTVETMDLTADVQRLAAEINGIKEQVRASVMTGAIEIGRRLKDAKALVGHGAWGAWLRDNVDYSERTAQNMMRIAEEYGRESKPAFADLNVTQAVLLLGVPAEEREEFVEAHDLDGMSTRELQAEIDALKAERAGMQARIEELGKAGGDAGLADSERSELLDKVSAAEQALRQARADAAAAAQKAREDGRAEGAKAAESKVTEAEARLGALQKELAEQAAAAKDAAEKAAAELEAVKGRQVQPAADEGVLREIEQLRAQVSRGADEIEVRAAFDVLKGAYERLKVKLGDVSDAELADKYRAAFGKALRIMADTVEAVRT